MIHITKKERETLSAFARRFSQRVQASGLLKGAKTKKFRRRKQNKNLRRQAALGREKKKAEYKKLWKLGKTK